MDQKKKAGIFLAAFGAVILGIILVSISQDKTIDKADGNVYIDIPDGESPEMSDSKSDAYLTYRGNENNIEDYWNDCEDEYLQAHTEVEEISGNGNSPSQVSSSDLFGADDSPAPVKPSGGTSANPYRESAKEREARHQRRREEALDLADRMQNGQRDDSQQEEKEEKIETIILPSNEVRRSDVISSLDDGWSDGGVSSLDAPQNIIPDNEVHPFKCMFVRDEKIKQGQRVSVRLLEDIVVGGVLIPKNSHLMASCNLGSRLELEISNIEMQGRILTLGYEAYDTDGTKGIYCPDVGSAGNTVKNRGTSLAGTALSSRVGRLASDVVSTGVSLIQNASGERSVSVPAGYTFYIVKKKQQ